MIFGSVWAKAAVARRPRASEKILETMGKICSCGLQAEDAMKRMLIGMIALSFPYAVQAHATYRHVDIGDSRALDAIQAANPAQYEKVIGILRRVPPGVSCEPPPKRLKGQYGAEHPEGGASLTPPSSPAKP